MKKHNAQIARSGIQYYLDSELPGLMLNSIPREFAGWKVFAVYRPSFVLEKMAKQFDGVPIRVHHKWVDNLADPNIIGKVDGDVKIKRLKDEVVLCAPLNIENEEDLPPFEELSPGYVSENIWQKGVAPNGEEYQILCTNIQEVNHLAIVQEARGGEDMKILDGGSKMAVHSGLIHAIRKRIKGVLDGKEKESFEGIIDTIKNDIDKLSADELEAQSKKLISLCDSLPDSAEKDKLKRYTADIPLLKAEDKAVCDEALKTIKESYQALDSDAVAELMEKKMAEQKEEKKEEVKDNAQPAAEEKKEEGKAADSEPEKKDVQDEDPMKKVCDALDALNEKLDKVLGTKDSEPEKKEVEEKKEEVEEKKENVSDSLPQYTQSLSAIEKGYKLEDEFARLKGRK